MLKLSAICLITHKKKNLSLPLLHIHMNESIPHQGRTKGGGLEGSDPPPPTTYNFQGGSFEVSNIWLSNIRVFEILPKTDFTTTFEKA